MHRTLHRGFTASSPVTAWPLPHSGHHPVTDPAAAVHAPVTVTALFLSVGDRLAAASRLFLITGLSWNQILSDQDVEIIAEAYGLPLTVVTNDADMVQAWQEPQDDLLGELARGKGWGAELTVRYLGALRRALGRDPRTPQ